MCGIAGYIGTNGPADPEILKRMLSAIGHRGPDHFSGFVDNRIALGVARLSIVDLMGGAQPSLSKDRRVAVAFNGEIFNYKNLRRDLSERGVTFHTRSEVETLLHLYLTHGEEFIHLVEGQFAIAVWDGRKERLLLYRDRFGIRPLFWGQSERTFVFGSEIKALFAHGTVAPRLNRAALAQAFRFWAVVGETTAFEAVRQIPAGHYLVVDRGTPELRRYWEFPIPGTVEPLDLPSDEAYFDAFAEQIDATIARQSMADVEVGCYLSGGIDSSVLASRLSDQRSNRPLRTYSITFEDPEFDEASAQRLVAERFDLDYVPVHIASREIGENFPQVVWQAETLLFRTAPVPLFLLSRRVHEDGIKVVMTGEGADEILLGYDLFRETAIRRFWGRRPDSTWRAALLKRLYAYLPQYRNPRYFNLLLDFYRPTLAEEGPHYSMAVRWNNGKALEAYFGPEMGAFADSYDPVEELDRWLPATYGAADDIDRAQCIESSILLGNYLLSSQGDRMSMAHAVEGRYPYLDERFVKFAASLPRRLKLRGLRDKFILRNAFGDNMPDGVRRRPKIAYQAPDLLGFFDDGQAPEYVESLLSPQRVREVGLFDPNLVTQLVTKGKSFALPRVGTRDNMAFVLILSTMLLDDIFVRKNWAFKSDVRIPAEMTLV